MTRPVVRETVTIAGRADRARVARAFVGGVLGLGHDVVYVDYDNIVVTHAGMPWSPVIRTAAFAVTGAADVLLTAVSRQPWPPALASVLILVPGLYLAWKAIPGSACHSDRVRAASARHRGRWPSGRSRSSRPAHPTHSRGSLPD
jgi:hypothetical protein